jgi:hypothetical protein
VGRGQPAPPEESQRSNSRRSEAAGRILRSHRTPRLMKEAVGSNLATASKTPAGPLAKCPPRHTPARKVAGTHPLVPQLRSA